MTAHEPTLFETARCSVRYVNPRTADLILYGDHRNSRHGAEGTT